MKGYNVKPPFAMARLSRIESDPAWNNDSGTTNGHTTGERRTMSKTTIATTPPTKKKSRGFLHCQVPTRKTLVRRLPIVDWLPKYQLGYLQHDLISGITAALTVIPQGIAYANLAGLPLQYGLYTSFMGLFTYCLFGTMKMIHVGPTSMMAILILDHVLVGGPAYAIWLSFICGCVEILFGILRLGSLVDFISLPVASGFSSAASVIVIVNLFKSIFGLKFSSSSFLDLVYKLIEHIPQTNFWDLSLGLLCIIVLVFLKKFNEIVKDWLKSQKVRSVWYRVSLSFLWFVLTARNAFVVLVAAVVAFFMVLGGLGSLTLSAGVESGLPDFSFPPLHVERNGESVGVMQIFKDLEYGIVLVPFVAILQHIAIAKSFANGKQVDATQEIITLGLCNVLGSFVGAFPVTASFSRTALNVTTGIKTTLSSSFAGILVLIALTVLAPTFVYIPKSTLAAVIITAVFSMIEYEMIAQLWRTKRSDLAVWLTTFFGCILLEAEYGILAGIGVSLLVLLYTMAKPSIRFYRSRGFGDELGITGEVIIVEPDRAIYFPSVEYTRYKLNKNIVQSEGLLLPVIFDGSLVSGVDYTAAEGFKRLVEDYKKRGGIIIFTNFKDEVLKAIQSTDPVDFPHCKTMDEICVAIQAFCSSTSKRMIDDPKSESDSSVRCDIDNSSKSLEMHHNPSSNNKKFRPILQHVDSESVTLLPDLNTPVAVESLDQPRLR